MKVERKKFNTFRQGRINVRKEARKQLVLRNNLEKRFYRQLSSLFKKFLSVQMYLYKQYGLYEPQIAEQTLNEDMFPIIHAHYKRVFKVMFEYNESKYNLNKKQDEAFVFGRSIDFENLVEQYFNTRQLVLAGISMRLATRISSVIEQGRADDLTLAQITKLVSDKFLPISRSRSALIARTETHNAASFASNAYFKTVEEDLGTKMLKKWVATNDKRTRSAHALANGQIVDMNEDFMVGGVPMEYAGDPKGGASNVINCRCVIIYADERDME